MRGLAGVGGRWGCLGGGSGVVEEGGVVREWGWWRSRWRRACGGWGGGGVGGRVGLGEEGV